MSKTQSYPLLPLFIHHFSIFMILLNKCFYPFLPTVFHFFEFTHKNIFLPIFTQIYPRLRSTDKVQTDKVQEYPLALLFDEY